MENYRITFTYDVLAEVIISAMSEDHARELFFEGEFTDDRIIDSQNADIEKIEVVE